MHTNLFEGKQSICSGYISPCEHVVLLSPPLPLLLLLLLFHVQFTLGIHEYQVIGVKVFHMNDVIRVIALLDDVKHALFLSLSHFSKLHSIFMEHLIRCQVECLDKTILPIYCKVLYQPFLHIHIKPIFSVHI